MQLSFPNGEHRDINFHTGEVTIGARSDMMVSLPQSDLNPHHASILSDRRGVWLRVLPDAQGIHLNGRPVKQLALLRSGDLLCFDQIRIQLRDTDAKSIQREVPEKGPLSLNETQQVSAARVLLRGLSGQHFGRIYGLVNPQLLGSGANASIQIEDSAVAEKHAQIELHGDKVILRAMNPKAITQINGIAVTDAVLSPGDQITIEQARFMLEAPGLPIRGRDVAVPSGTVAHTQTTVPVVTAKAAHDTTGRSAIVQEQENNEQSPQDTNALWWLIAAAAILAASLTALLVYAPRGGI
jgi:Inner membrane component of T3SS, cytoplasmic domain/FHA domain